MSGSRILLPTWFWYALLLAARLSLSWVEYPYTWYASICVFNLNLHVEKTFHSERLSLTRQVKWGLISFHNLHNPNMYVMLSKTCFWRKKFSKKKTFFFGFFFFSSFCFLLLVFLLRFHELVTNTAPIGCCFRWLQEYIALWKLFMDAPLIVYKTHTCRTAWDWE